MNSQTLTAASFLLSLLAVSVMAMADLPALSSRAVGNGATRSQEQGIEFVSVHATGNAPWPGTDTDLFAGRGSVANDFRIGRTEITSGQWMEFINTVGPLDTTGSISRGLLYVLQAGFWQDISYAGPGYRAELNPFVPNAAMQPVVGITWYNAARYCNWLHNGKQASLESLQYGAYDASTWGREPSGRLTDAPGHEPGARFWLPTLDQIFAAMYYDPNQGGPGQPGWWSQPNSSNTPLTPGPPELGGQTSGAFNWRYPIQPSLGVYTDQQSPWGLLDGSGGGAEWTDEMVSPSFPTDHVCIGSATLSPSTFQDSIGAWDNGPYTSFRIATAIPSPTVLSTVGLGCLLFLYRRNRNVA